jgi:hypothetical protein
MRTWAAAATTVLVLLGFLAPQTAAQATAANPYPASAVGMALTPDGQGWWLADQNGAVATGGTAASYGSAAGVSLSRPIVGIAATPSGHGYWLVASDGGIFAFGDAAFHGSTGSMHLNKPIVGMAATPDGGGYWLVASDGGIFSFGDAAFHGSTGSMHLNKPIVAVVPTRSGAGYWLVASDGGIFSFGDAAFHGSTGSLRLNQPIVGGAATGDNGGYWLVASDGGIFAFGDAAFTGSAAGSLAAPVVGMVASAAGYALAAANGAVAAFGGVASALGVPTGSVLSTPASPAPTAPAGSSSGGSVTTAGTGSGSTSGAPGAADPSGVAMPSGNLPGWQQVFADDFTGASLNTNAWGAYQGEPGGDAGGWWDPSHVVVGNGMLQLQSYVDPAHANPANPAGYVSGGVSSAPALKQTYGKYEIRFRVDQGDGIAAVLLLWPSADGVWPPEIDFAEDGGGNRNQMTATLHCGANGNDSCQIQNSVTADFSQWQTIGVEWSPGLLNFTLNGTTWATITGSQVPSIPMEMDLQTQAGTCGDPYDPCPDASTPALVNMDVDWVVAYQPVA